jgi:hypothetical protein
MRKNKTLILLGGLVLLLSLIVSPVRAQQTRERPAIELQIGPTKSKLTLDPEASATGSFKVRNNGQYEFDYTVYVRPYYVVDENYTADFESERNYTQISRWITLEKESGHLGVDETQEINYTVNVPADVPDGGQYAAIFVETGLELDPGATGIATRQRLGHLLYGRIAGRTREEGRLVAQEIPKWWYWSGPIQATALVENTGNVDFDTNYTLKAANVLGKPRDEVTREVVVLPDTKRLVTNELADLAPFGIYKVTQSVEVLGVEQTITRTVWVVSPLIIIIIAGLLVLEGIYFAGQYLIGKIKKNARCQKKHRN